MLLTWLSGCFTEHKLSLEHEAGVTRQESPGRGQHSRLWAQLLPAMDELTFFLIRELTIATACDSLFLCLLLAFVLFCLRQCLSLPNWPGTGSEDQVGLELTETLSTLSTHAGVKGVPNRPGHTSFLLIFPYTSWATVLSLTNCVCRWHIASSPAVQRWPH